MTSNISDLLLLLAAACKNQPYLPYYWTILCHYDLNS